MHNPYRPHAICRIDGRFAGQAPLDDSYALATLKHYARARHAAGRDVTLRRGLPEPVFASACQHCAAIVRWKTEDTAVRCSGCGAQASSWDAKLGIVYSWRSAAEVAAMMGYPPAMAGA